MADTKNTKNKVKVVKLSSIRTLQSKKIVNRSSRVNTSVSLKKPVQFKFRPVAKNKNLVRYAPDLGLAKPSLRTTNSNNSVFVHRKYGSRVNPPYVKGFNRNRYNPNYVDKSRLIPTEPESSVTSKPPVKRALFLFLKRTNNNIFMSLSYRNGLPIYQTSGGATGISGSKRDTPASAETAAKLLVNQVVNRGYTKCYLRIDSVYDNTLRGAVRGLQSSGLLTFTKIQQLKTVAHNGVRKSKPRRT